MSILDIMSFRDLYGYMTADKAAEIERLKAAAGARLLSREGAEAELFATARPTATAAPAARIEERDLLDPRSRSRWNDDLFARVYSQQEIDGGVATNAAVRVDDPRRLRETMRGIEAAARAAGLEVKAVTWQEASGMIGMFVTLARVVLFTAVLILFAVALVIINNALVMATLERMAEIGTLRAIGAQRRFLLGMLVVETLVVGGLFGGIGAALGVGVLALLRMVGIPASNDTLYFLFSGSRLYPGFSPVNVAIALIIVFLVSGASSIYPALLAMQVSPRQAMQTDE